MKALASALLLALPVAAFAQEAMTLCVEDQAAAPYTFPTKDGTMQVLIKMAAKQANVPVTMKVAPWKRCIDEVRSGATNGLVNAGFTPFHAEYAAYPMQGDKPNTAAALARMDILAYRVKGSNASWDGSKFQNVSKPVLIPSGFATISDRLKSMNVPYDDNTKEPARNFHKLIAGQGEILLGFDGEMNALLSTRKEFSDKVEVLPKQFMTADFYAPVSKTYYAANKEKVEALWAAIGKVKKSKEYQDAIKDIK